MSYNYIQTVTIELGGTYTNAPEIGMFTNQLRFSERQLSGVSEQWASGFINSISPISQIANFELTGSSATASGVTINLCNIEQLKFKLLAINSNLTLKNCKVLIHEFVGTDSDSDSVSKDLLFVGLIDTVDFSDTDLFIKVTTTKISRKANIMHFLNIDNKNIGIPVTFGRSYPEDKIFFKAIRLNDIEDPITVEELALYNEPSVIAYENYYPPDLKTFFVSQAVNENVGGVPTRVFRIRLGYLDMLAIPSSTYFVNKWVHVTSGAGQGEYAKIKYSTVKANGYPAEIEIELYDFLKTQWKGNNTGTATDQTWLNIVSIDKSYRLDDFPCYGWFNKDNQMISSQAELYIKDSLGNPKKLPDFGYDVDTNFQNNCSLIINPRLFQQDTDEMSSYEFVPFRKYKYLDTLSDANKNWTTIDGILSNMTRVYQDGLFFWSNISGLTIDSFTISDIDEPKFCDKNLSTFHEIHMNISYQNLPGNSQIWKIGKFLTLELPRLAKDFTFSNVYLGVVTDEWHTFTSGGTYGGTSDNQQITTKYLAAKKKFIGAAESIASFNMESLDGRTQTIDNLPDFYIQRNLNNRNFYTSSPNTDYLRTKYNLINLNITSREDYENIYEILFGHVYSGVTENVTYVHQDSVQTYFLIKELFLIFETTASIKREIYV